ncbi:hypothetical protein RHA1_ro09020 (plasmid) [Rhodococcus jostii RHA1]|uniref:Uncharacterized protein n=1 Tax=Rhodococcus jostii (strain RHA1) TaxID=101510 RepID=Q0RXC2_RHOJR|nr:hypothetical protein RHA1_ro09020 [Rhodococcus jostii RHA1]
MCHRLCSPGVGGPMTPHMRDRFDLLGVHPEHSRTSIDLHITVRIGAGSTRSGKYLGSRRRVSMRSARGFPVLTPCAASNATAISW